MTCLLGLLLASVLVLAIRDLRRRRTTRALRRRVEDLTRALDGTWRALQVERDARLVALPQESDRLVPRHVDRTLSPLTGYTRQTWLDLASDLLDGVLAYSGELSRPLRLPRLVAAGRPGFEANGRSDGQVSARLEAFARTFLLAACVLRARPDYAVGGRAVLDYYLECLTRGTSEASPDYFGSPSGEAPEQQLCEAALVAAVLGWLLPDAWSSLDGRARDRCIRWFRLWGSAPSWENNWLWFRVLIQTFLGRVTGSKDTGLVDASLTAILSHHVDEGWFHDAGRYDYYSAWAYQFYPSVWLAMDGGAHALAPTFTALNDAFLERWPQAFSSRGEIPLWGRSPCYRFAAAAPFAAAFLRGSAPTLDPGQARFLCSGAIRQFVEHPGFLTARLPSMGFLGEDETLIDDYLSTASTFWCAKTFVALALEGNHPFWTAIEAAPPRHDVFEWGATGLRFLHRPDGHVVIETPPGRRISGDPRYDRDSITTAPRERHGGVD